MASIRRWSISRMPRGVLSPLLGALVLGAALPGVAAGQRASQQAGQQVSQQQLFGPLFPAHPPLGDYARSHPTIEHCVAAARRLEDSLRRVTDTMQPLVTAVRRCGARFTVAGTAAVDLPLLWELVVHGEQDSVVGSVLARRIALVPADSAHREGATLLKLAVKSVMELRRFAWAERLAGHFTKLGRAAGKEPVAAYWAMAGEAFKLRDSVRAEQYMRAVDQWTDSLSKEDVQSGHRHWRTIIALGRGLQAVARGEATEFPFRDYKKRPAPPIQADFWFHRADSTTPRPAPGKPNLVLLVEHDLGCGSDCARRWAPLRALAEQVGDALDITLVTHTHGYWRGQPLSSPAEEAQRIAQYLFDEAKLPGALAVEVTKSTRLPAPDRRRVDQITPNVEAYQPRAFFEQDNWHYAPTWFNNQYHGHAQGQSLNDKPLVHGYLVDRTGQIAFDIELTTDLGWFEGMVEAAVVGWLAREARTTPKPEP